MIVMNYANIIKCSTCLEKKFLIRAVGILVEKIKFNLTRVLIEQIICPHYTCLTTTLGKVPQKAWLDLGRGGCFLGAL